MGLGGWLTNYKRIGQLPPERRMDVTIGDFEHFDNYITEWDVKNFASFGIDHVRLAFDQIVLEDFNNPYHYRDETFQHITDFLDWAKKYGLNVILNLHKAIDLVPKDLLCCDWHYGKCDAYRSVDIFADHGLRVMVCPWKISRTAKIFLA